MIPTITHSLTLTMIVYDTNNNSLTHSYHDRMIPTITHSLTLTMIV